MWWSFIETESGGEVLVCLLIQLQLLIGGGGGQGRGDGSTKQLFLGISDSYCQHRIIGPFIICNR